MCTESRNVDNDDDAVSAIGANDETGYISENTMTDDDDNGDDDDT